VRPRNLRVLTTALFTVVLTGLALYSAVQGWSSDRARDRAAAEQTTADLRTLVSLWERVILERTAEWIAEVGSGGSPGLKERDLIAQVGWFDALYVWSGGESGVRVLHPGPAIGFDAAAIVAGTPCLAAARRIQLRGDRRAAADAFLTCVDAGPLPARLLAGELAGRALLAMGQPDDAWAALVRPGLALRTPLRDGLAMGLSPVQLVQRTSLAAEIQRARGQEDAARGLELDLATAIATLSGPELPAVLPRAQHLRNALQAHLTPAESAALDARLRRAEARVNASEEVRDRLGRAAATAPPASWSDGVRIVQDRYSEPGFLLLWAPVGASTAVAAQVDVASLIRTLLRADGLSLSGSPRRLIARDDRGNTVTAEGAAAAGVVVAEVPLGRLLPHWTLAIVEPARPAHSRVRPWAVGELLPVLGAVIVAVIGLTLQSAAQRRERELIERQADFVARVTHELKTPLAGIRVMVETLEMGAASDPATVRRFLGRILQETNRLEERINEVLQMARAPAKHEDAPVDLVGVAKELAEQWAPRFATEGCSLEADLRPAPPIRGDRALLRDAISNLLDNALKYRREGTKGRVVLRTGEAGRWAIVEVTDNGIGVPVEARKRIFQRFARVEGPGRGRAGGHGLGLAFVAEAVQAHGGAVECGDGTDGGARFRIKLRRAP
jgi:signal transduction histidine kinase